MLRSSASSFERIEAPVLEAFAQKQLDANAVQNIQDLREQVKSAIDDAKHLTGKAKRVLYAELTATANNDPSKLPELVSKVRTLDENCAKFESKLESLRDHFRTKSRGKLLNFFSELSLEEQQVWLEGKGDFEAIVKEHQGFTKEYMAFSAERRQRICPNFKDLSKPQKQLALEELRTNLEKHYFNTLKGPLGRHFSSKSAHFAESYFRSAPTDKREEALKMLEGHMLTEARLTFKLEEYLRKYPSFRKEYEVKFFEASYEEKEKILQEISMKAKTEDGLAAHKKELLDSYKTLLAEERKQGTIAPKTEKAFVEFEELGSLEFYQKAVENFKKGAPERKKLLNDFETLLPKVPEKKRKALKAKFLEASQQERLQIFFQLKTNLTQSPEEVAEETDAKPEADQKKKKAVKEKSKKEKIPNNDSKKIKETPDFTPQIHMMRFTAEHLETNHKYEEAIKILEAILGLDKEDQEAKTSIKRLQERLRIAQMTQKEADQKEKEFSKQLPKLIAGSLEKRKNSKAFQDQARAVNLGLLLATLAQNTERTQGSIKASRRIKGLQTHEQVIQQQLETHTNGQIIVDRQGKAADVQSINIGGLKSAKPEDLGSLQAKYGALQHDEKARNLGCRELQMIDNQGRIISGAEAYTQAVLEQFHFKMQTAQEIALEISKKTGQPFTMELIQSVATNINDRDIGYDLAG